MAVSGHISAQVLQPVHRSFLSGDNSAGK